jgi:hypothetical protein
MELLAESEEKLNITDHFQKPIASYYFKVCHPAIIPHLNEGRSLLTSPLTSFCL